VKRENPDKYPQITVKWADHYQDEDDVSLDFIKEKASDPENYIGDYTGRLVFENKRIIVICANVWNGEEGDDNFSSPMFIMKKSITYRSDKA
jgi:hypothetical protein